MVSGARMDVEGENGQRQIIPQKEIETHEVLLKGKKSGVGWRLGKVEWG